MRLSIAILGLVVGGSAVLAAWAGVSRPPKAPEPPPVTGMDLLRRYACHQSETKVIVVHGVEDGFSPAGDEPVFIRPERRTAQAMSWLSGSAFDQSQPDRPFTDSLPIPDRVASALLVIGLRANGNDASDTIGLGDLATSERMGMEGWQFGTLIARVRGIPGWRVDGAIHSVDLKSLPTKLHAYFNERDRSDHRPLSVARYRPLSDIIRQRGLRWIDVLVQDDTSVDFVGLAVCQEPPRGKGLTLAKGVGPSASVEGTIFLACSYGAADEHVCDPIAGDMPCSTPLPVACLRPGSAPVPEALERLHSAWSWTGGFVALTAPVPASRFRRIGEVDRYCAARFGPRWRTAELHDGYSIKGLTGYGRMPAGVTRAWIDIADQPYATCWSR